MRGSSILISNVLNWFISIEANLVYFNETALFLSSHTIRREIPDDRDGDRSLKYQHLKIPSHPYLHPDPFIPKFANSSGIPLGFFQSMILVVQMPFYDKTLRYWLDNRSSQHESICCVKNLEIFTKIAHGVDYLHANGIIHFDIKV